MRHRLVCRSLLPPKSFGLRLPNSEGAACPTIRYYRPWYYVVVLVLEGGVYQEVVARAPQTISSALCICWRALVLGILDLPSLVT